MVEDWRDYLAIDPRLEACGIEVQAARLPSKNTPEFSAVLRRSGKRWPKRAFILQAYGPDGVMVYREDLAMYKSLDTEVRHLHGNFIFKEEMGSAFELIVEDVGDSTRRNVDNRYSEWEEIEVRAETSATQALGIELAGLRAQVHRDFDSSNLLIVDVGGQVLPAATAPPTAGLCVEFTVFDHDGTVLNWSRSDLGFGPSSRRPFCTQIQLWDHDEPHSVVVVPFTV